MARPTKKGLGYFPLDSSIFSDRKIKILMARYGADGFTVYMYVLCEIYKEGYCLILDHDFEYIAASDLNMSVEKIGQILAFLYERSLLTSILLTPDTAVISSVGIQRRFQEAVKSRAVKKSVIVDERCWLLDASETAPFIKVRSENSFSENNKGFSENNEGFSENNATNKSKVNESKVKENKGKETVYAETETASAPKPLFPILLNDGSLFGFTKDQIAEWEELYPGVDVEQAMRNMQAWCKANPSRRKTKSGVMRFVTNWLVSDQNSGRNKRRQNTANTYGGADDFCALMEDGNDENGD